MSPEVPSEGEGPRDPLGPTWKELARRLVQGIGVSDPRIRDAMLQVPRHRFLRRPWEAEAYDDTPLPIGPEATISAPHMVALQLEYAKLEPGHRVLEVGSGSGYLCALLAHLVAPRGAVFGVEFEEELVEEARNVLVELGLAGRVDVRTGDGAVGWREEAPFDRVLVSYAVDPPLPPTWVEQTREGGLLLVPLRGRRATFLERYRKVRRAWVHDARGPACLFVASKSRRVPSFKSSLS